MRKHSVLISLAVSAAMALPAAAQQSAHVHGIADINLAIEGDELEIEFVSPSEGIVGFEYAPSTHAEEHAVEDAIALLRDPSNLFDLPADAGCRLHEVEAERHAEGDHEDHGHKDEHAHDDHDEDEHDDHAKHEGHDDDDHAHDEHGHDDHDEEVHSEFHAHYHFDCANPSSIKEIGLTLFKTWPRIEKIRVQALTASGQTGGNIEAKDPVIRLQ